MITSQFESIVNFNNNYGMNLLELERLTRENDKHTNKLIVQGTSIDCLKNDLQTQAQVINRQNVALEEAKKQIKILKRKLEEQEMERERVQSRYLLVLQRLEEELEQSKKKYSKLENKIIPLIDNDTVRLKILNEVESNHQMELNTFKGTIDNLKDEVLRLRRENEILKHVLDNQKSTHQQQLRKLKATKNAQYTQDSINYINYSIWKDIEGQLKSKYENSRKQADFYKQKYFAVQKKYQDFLSASNKQQESSELYYKNYKKR